MKIKVNTAKETISIKGLTPLEFSVIEALLNHVRLGQEDHDGGASAVPFEFSRAIEEAANDLDELDMEDITVVAMPSNEIDDVTLYIESPTIEVYVD